MNVAASSVQVKSAAPGSYLGFSLQQVRLCYHLLKVPENDAVSLEYLDDVAVHRADGTHLLEQCKSAQSSNPVTDRSEELWNTFTNWADRCAAGLDPSSTDFILYVTPDKNGDLVLELHGAQASSALSAALAKVKGLVDPAKPDVGCNPHVARFLKAGDAVCMEIIRRFNLTTEKDPIEAIRELLRSVLPPETLDDFCAVAIGMARESADTLIREKQLPIVQAANLRKQFGAFIRKHDLSGLLLSKATEPAQEIVSALVSTSPVFVQQLQAIEATHDLLVTAVSDFLRAEADKVDWASEGLIVADSLDELDGQLVRQHTIFRDEIEDTMSTQAEPARGRALYRRCGQTKLPLEGRDVPSHFIPGAFNSLADVRKIGWHPLYQSLFPSD